MRPVLSIILLLMSFTASAGMFGEENVSLAKMVTQLEAMYNKMITMVEEAKAQNETLLRVNEGIKQIEEERDAVQNTFLRHLDQRVARDVDALASPYDFSGKSIDEQLTMLSRALDQRIRAADSPAEKQLLAEQKQAIEREQYLRELEKASAENLKNASDGVTDKEAQQIAAQSAAIYAALAAAEGRRQAEQERASLGDAVRAEKILNNNAAVFGAAAK
ncbi:MAG: hypothetical protein FD165_2622 [Gammaproteobacteria bacterium]|nr:MAG: hypothetical protein FD165_2622 [Gammaproteobacteria bacterium]TND01595.1 MAG: hypothetical protein FD120_2543 [Gammaproteobacteria bacterium]